MRDYFTWNGVASTVYGLHVTEQPSIILPAERATFTPIAGRSGTLTETEGDHVYDDFILTVECGVSNLSQIRSIAAWLRGAGQLELPEQPGGYYYARVVNQIEFAKLMRGRAPRSLTVTFRCKPFWYVTQTDSSDIILTSSGSSVTNLGDIESEPIITIAGSGDITLLVDDQIIELEDIDGEITLDTPLGEAYNDDGPLNGNVSGDLPTLPTGSFYVSWTGTVSSVTITPNTRYFVG